MKLSIIIVNYNVRSFLEQCLCSVQKAIAGMDAEVLVVDNNSTDDSIAFLGLTFPWVRFMANKENVGFGKANNQALKEAKGSYILFLNPDTLLPEDCLQRCLGFMESHADAGALGIRMVDGAGAFLPESKRAFPSPLTSLFKLSGLSFLFPKSRLFGRYHLGHLSADRDHEVDVLAGAFMLVRKEVLDKVGSFDEVFFMYGEDVDLSYRIQMAGWKNYYFSGSSIIHFKGESTKKGSLNYVRMFYQAMMLFVKKHYGGSRAAVFNVFIQFAILLRAMLTAFANLIRWVGLPLIDAVIVMLSLLLTKYVWTTQVKPGVELMPSVLRIGFPVFTLLFILAGSIAGLYDKWYRPLRAWYAMMVAVVIDLAVYSLLNEQYRFSRGIILFGGLLASLCIILFRWALVRSKVIDTQDEDREYHRTLIVGSPEMFEETSGLMQVAGRNERVLGRIDPGGHPTGAISDLASLDELLQDIPARELIFCMDGQLSMAQVMQQLQHKRAVRYKFHYQGTRSIIGSDSKDSSGETLVPEMAFNLSQPQELRNKRVTDVICCLLSLITLPIHLIFVKHPLGFIRNLFLVGMGKRTWVGYHEGSTGLPPIRKGIISITARPVGAKSTLSAESLRTIDHWYAKDHQWTDDVRSILKGYRWLGH